MCERFHCLPWELDGQDVGRLLRGTRLLDIYRSGVKLRQGEKLSAAENQEVGELLQWELEHERSRHPH